MIHAMKRGRPMCGLPLAFYLDFLEAYNEGKRTHPKFLQVTPKISKVCLNRLLADEILV